MIERNQYSPASRALTSSRVGWLLLAASFTSAAQESGHPVSMWRLDGDVNSVYLLGSVHLLRAGDHPLPSVIHDAYEDAETLIMELDMDDIDPVEAQSLLTELGLIHDDRSLNDLMGPGPYAEAETFANRADIPLAMLAKSEPWLAAITVEQLMLARIGFNPLFGIESHLTEKAALDDKEILGLETIRQQLEFLDSMSLESQRALLLQSLKESVDIRKIMDELIDAWRHGDLAFMEDNMLDDMRQYPELYQTIVVDRNIDWAGQFEDLLDEDDDYLIVVGALHLIGDDGVPALLTKRGRDVVQLQQPPLQAQ
ncbi:MAG TPA: TraB/GumN family protein [Woeseiaceae bacterium]